MAAGASDTYNVMHKLRGYGGRICQIKQDRPAIMRPQIGFLILPLGPMQALEAILSPKLCRSCGVTPVVGARFDNVG